jgi:hypothetical protein
MLHCVALVRTDVSEGLSTSTIRGTKICELGMLAITSNGYMLQRNRKDIKFMLSHTMDGMAFKETSLNCYLFVFIEDTNHKGPFQ